jgi:hypothetical protein
MGYEYKIMNEYSMHQGGKTAENKILNYDKWKGHIKQKSNCE